jgi:outer membrane biosynthesis protein TonB
MLVESFYKGYNLNSMRLYFLSKSPFFLASILVHMGIFYLLSFLLIDDIIKRNEVRDKVIDVELIKIENPAKNSIIENNTQRPTFVTVRDSNLKDPDERVEKSVAIKEIATDDINTKSNIFEGFITSKTKIARQKGDNQGSSPSIVSRIIYRDDPKPDIKKPTDGRLLAHLSFQDKSPLSEVSKSSPDIQKSRDFHKSDVSPTFSEQNLKQDYELARLFIQEKANRFVPVVYQKRLLEKKKRTAIVEVVLQKQGYVESHRILKSTGLVEMDNSIRAILHLAEPYIYVPTPVSIELIFLE